MPGPVTDLRIIIVAEHASAEFGGEALLPLQYFRLLRKRNIDVRLVVHCRTRPELERLLGTDINRVSFVPDLWIHKRIASLSRWLPGRVSLFTVGNLLHFITQILQWRVVRQLVRDFDVDVVHEPIPVSPRMPSLMFALGAPVVVGPFNGGMGFPDGYDELQSTFERWFLIIGRALASFVNLMLPGKRLAKVVLVANERTRKALPFKPGCKVRTLVENGVDLSVFQYRQPTPVVDRPVRFCFLGQLVYMKAVDVLIAAIRIARDSVDIELSIIGDGEERSGLEELVARLDLVDVVTFHGFVPQTACPELLAQQDAFVLPSIHECGGAVVMEAMASGLPVVATDWGGPPDYLDETCGILVDPSGGRKVFAERLSAELIRMAESFDLRLQLAERARAKVEREFTWARKIDAILDIYHTAIDRAPSHISKDCAAHTEVSPARTDRQPELDSESSLPTGVSASADPANVAARGDCSSIRSVARSDF